ncbi:MAG TPA: M28 family peptidase [Euzebyales bacterium]
MWAALVLIAVVIAAGRGRLPASLDTGGGAGVGARDAVSAERAMDYLRTVASQPRSIGTPAHEATIDTIQSRLDALGVESQIVEDGVATPDFGQVFAGRLRNVIARIPGTDSTGAVLLISHYDSLPTSLNANDGGLGVATALETVRALQAGPAPVNDITLWFGDADATTAMNSRCCCSPDRSPNAASRRSASPHSSSSRSHGDPCGTAPRTAAAPPTPSTVEAAPSPEAGCSPAAGRASVGPRIRAQDVEVAAVGAPQPLQTLDLVVLPDPFGSGGPKISPACTSNDTSATATVAPCTFRRLRTRTASPDAASALMTLTPAHAPSVSQTVRIGTARRVQRPTTDPAKVSAASRIHDELPSWAMPSRTRWGGTLGPGTSSVGRQH